MDLKPIIESVSDDIASHGFSVIMTEQIDPYVTYAYTIGLSKIDHPELFMVGFDFELMKKLINIAGAKILNNELKFTDGSFSDEVIMNYKVRFDKPTFSTARSETPFGMLEYYSNGDWTDALQIVLPDEFGRFPNEAGCQAEMANYQTRLQSVIRDKPTKH